MLSLAMKDMNAIWQKLPVIQNAWLHMFSTGLIVLDHSSRTSLMYGITRQTSDALQIGASLLHRMGKAQLMVLVVKYSEVYGVMYSREM